MRRIALLLLLALAPTAAAQDGCTQDAPCPWVLDVSADGIGQNAIGGTYYNGTLCDWYYFIIQNLDSQTHTIRVPGLGGGLEWTVPADSDLDTAAFELDEAGTFDVTDEPSGDTAEMNILIEDVVDGESTSPTPGGDDNGAPAPAALGVLAILGLAARLRRR